MTDKRQDNKTVLYNYITFIANGAGGRKLAKENIDIIFKLYCHQFEAGEVDEKTFHEFLDNLEAVNIEGGYNVDLDL